ncbi:MAG TPA: phenylalanine--tRNA ligase subunit beta, partial [Gaiellales bacterium]|nr:phenylalanine--tRNA ligase subunit beta [Gaiellales bacterium]
MRVPVSWLREYVSFDLPVRELGELMSMTGTKVEAIHRTGVPGDAGLFRIGRVVTRGQHPDADRLSLCQVDVGEGELRQIVCGATNFAPGDTVAVALPGATLPDGTELRVAKLRGVESHGMMLSERELELSADHAGLMLLPDGPEPGSPLVDVLPIADEVIEFEITSNRPDCLSVYGVAREVSASLDADLAPWPGIDPVPAGSDTVDDWVRARIDAPELCPRWAGRVFTDVRVGPSPPWLKARIAAAGMRPISNVVDITNYVMLCLGEPTHAFDLDKVTGREIIVR